MGGGASKNPGMRICSFFFTFDAVSTPGVGVQRDQARSNKYGRPAKTSPLAAIWYRKSAAGRGSWRQTAP